MSGQREVLLVDDEADIRELCRINLEIAGWKVREASHSADVVPAVRRQRPDAVVLDLRMPGGDGWSVLAALKSDPDLAAVPVVLLSADSMAGERISCWVPGLLELVEKPFLPATLIETLRRAGDADTDAVAHAEQLLAELPGRG